MSQPSVDCDGCGVTTDRLRHCEVCEQCLCETCSAQHEFHHLLLCYNGCNTGELFFCRLCRESFCYDCMYENDICAGCESAAPVV